MRNFARASRLARSPLLHFLGIGAALFFASRVAGETRDPASRRIVVGEGHLESLAARFARSAKRPPSLPELRGLVEEHVRQEILFRESVALGLDRDDVVVQRRLRQKMEFIAGDDAAEGLYERLRARYHVVIEAR